MSVSMTTVGKIMGQKTITLPTRKVFVIGNSKLGKQVAIFSLPPVKTCKVTKWCYSNCYAMKANFQFKTVIEANEDRYQMSKRKDFVTRAVAELKAMKNVRYVRLHTAGDFYSAEYVMKWMQIAFQCKDKQFLAYTKRYDLKEALEKFNRLPNVHIFESLDESCVEKKTEFKTAMVSDEPLKGFFSCPGSCEPCGHKCWTGINKVAFQKH